MTMRLLTTAIVGIFILAAGSQAQFQFFEHMFSGAHHHHEPQNVASDSSWYQQKYSDAYCTNYLCPDTLACVAVPHHCPCQHPGVEDKFELGEGSAVCVSKGGFKSSEAARKVELARKGLL